MADVPEPVGGGLTTELITPYAPSIHPYFRQFYRVRRYYTERPVSMMTRPFLFLLFVCVRLFALCLSFGLCLGGLLGLLGGLLGLTLGLLHLGLVLLVERL